MTLYHTDEPSPLTVSLSKDFEPRSEMPTPRYQPSPPVQSFDLFHNQRLENLPLESDGPELPEIVRKALEGIKDRYPTTKSMEFTPDCPEFNIILSYALDGMYSEQKDHIESCYACSRVAKAAVNVESENNPLANYVYDWCMKQSKE